MKLYKNNYRVMHFDSTRHGSTFVLPETVPSGYKLVYSAKAMIKTITIFILGFCILFRVILNYK
jgi:hypothetical protein